MDSEPLPGSEGLGEFAWALVEAGGEEAAIAQVAAEACRRLLMAQRCAVWLASPAGDEVVLRAAAGYERLAPQAIGRLSYPLARPADEPLGVVPWVHVNQATVTTDTHAKLRAHAAYRGEFERQLYGVGPDEASAAHPRRQFCGAPISLGPERLGVLVLENKTVLDNEGARAFSASDRSRLTALTSVLGLALIEARRSREEGARREAVRHALVQSLREQAMDFQEAHGLLAPAAGGAPEAAVAAGAQLLQFAIVELGFWLDGVDRLAAQDAEWLALSHGEVVSLLRHETLLLRRLAGHRLEAHLEAAPSSGVRVRTAPLYLVAGVKGLLRHAYCEVVRRQQREAASGLPIGRGRVEVSCRVLDRPGSPEGASLCVGVVDDGEVACHEGARERLARAWGSVQAGEASPDDRHGGLDLVQWVARAHGGRLELRLAGGRTERELHLPLLPGGEHRKEAEDG